jgi:beta-carotene hydroxylase
LLIKHCNIFLRSSQQEEDFKMSDRTISFEHLTPEQKARFKSLTSAPRLAWPALVMWVGLNVAFLCSYYFGGTGQIPLWAGMLINSVVGYAAFSVVHDSVHRSISSNTIVNDWTGQLALLLVAPYVTLSLFRWGHILHHRFANGPKDPDIVLHGPWWQLPFRWMFIDIIYLHHAIRHGDKISKPFLVKSLCFGALFIAAAVALIAAGYGMDVLMLWFVPSRIIFLMLGFSFFWLPHVPHDVTQEENFTQATTIRLGLEWFMGPLLQNQNFHLIHHLFPMTPFYNNDKVWRLLESELRKKDLAIQHGFAIRPVIYGGRRRSG